jgi:hypothetical protein
MNSILNPFNEDVLMDHIGIDKVGYRHKILFKLKEDSLTYLE